MSALMTTPHRHKSEFSDIVLIFVKSSLCKSVNTKFTESFKTCFFGCIFFYINLVGTMAIIVTDKKIPDEVGSLHF